ncbi:uncharacterized protein LOC123880872 [Maniola jurtina]|uniref:uncharacterized protein LOC123880872 n=1 Tax=Maniola jurtina TaxID=191418 RepID=UPI001E687E14|nr:uncharacterized protein LOC123880872 [Maniola jurtina]
MADKDMEEKLKKLSEENAALQARLGEKSQVCKVTAKIPPFWAHKPIIWFATVEAQFEIAGIITDSTKYSYVLGHLDQKYSQEVEDIITNPPPIGQRYTRLKDELIRRLSMSEEERVRQLISDEELGDRKPSQFLRHLRSLAGSALSDENILRQLWMRRLPQQVQVVTASQLELPLDKLAELADRVVEVTNPKQVSACATAQSAPSTSTLNTLMEKVEELTKQVAALSSHSHSRSRSHSRAKPFTRPTTTRDGTPVRPCWYHKRFASKATKCTKPCNWSENTNNSQ